MSRQIRMQIPQMQKQEKRKNTGKKKKVDKSACLLVIILLFFLLTASDTKKLNSTLNETFDFVKNRIERYEIYNTND